MPFSLLSDSSDEELHSEAPGYTEEQIKREASEKKVDFFKADSKDISFEMVDADERNCIVARKEGNES